MNIETNEQYHANEAISHSKLELFRRRPISYYRRFVAKTVTGSFVFWLPAQVETLNPATIASFPQIGMSRG